MSESNSNWLLPAIVVVALVAAAVWFYRQQPNAPVPAEQSAGTETAPAAPTGPQYPVPLPGADSGGQLIDLPSLDDSDAYFKLELLGLFGEALDNLLVESGLIDKFVITIDNLPQSSVAERVRPLRSIEGPFPVEPADVEGTYVIGGDNAARYAPLIGVLSSADPQRVMETYSRFYPLMQEAYVRLGYPDAYFNDRLIAVIDHLLAAPEPETPLRLVRPNVLYQYADPELEALSAGQKLMLRMGRENAATVKALLRDYRNRLAGLGG